jgi:hypothetical protein
MRRMPQTCSAQLGLQISCQRMEPAGAKLTLDGRYDASLDDQSAFGLDSIGTLLSAIESRAYVCVSANIRVGKVILCVNATLPLASLCSKAASKDRRKITHVTR